MAGRLTTHVLDIAQGRPAVGLVVEVWYLGLNGDVSDLLQVQYTNADGRSGGPLLEDEAFQAGVYEIVFAVGPYFAKQHIPTSAPPFLDRVPIRFTVADANAHYHVPLLVSPWAYSTYRGS